MATRPTGYGLSAEIARARNLRYNEEDEQDALAWIEAVIDEGEIFAGVAGRQKTAEELRNGVWLCKLMNQLNPNKKIKINTPKSTNSTIPPFKCMENIGNFLTACKDYGLKPGDLFQTSDLYDATNMLTVINCIHAVGRKAQTNGYQGPVLGPRESDTNVREFSEEKLRAGDVIIGLQMGSNKGATQAGLIMGKNRSVLD